MAPRPSSSDSGNRWPYVSIVSAMAACPNLERFGDARLDYILVQWAGWGAVLGAEVIDGRLLEEPGGRTTSPSSPNSTLTRLRGKLPILVADAMAVRPGKALARIWQDGRHPPARPQQSHMTGKWHGSQ
jgi:hypothetical protein